MPYALVTKKMNFTIWEEKTEAPFSVQSLWKKGMKNYLVGFVNDIFAVPNITWDPFPTYLLIFPEKNHGILAGKYDLSDWDDSGWSQQLLEKISKLRRKGEAFLFGCISVS